MAWAQEMNVRKRLQPNADSGCCRFIARHEAAPPDLAGRGPDLDRFVDWSICKTSQWGICLRRVALLI